MPRSQSSSRKKGKKKKEGEKEEEEEQENPKDTFSGKEKKKSEATKEAANSPSSSKKGNKRQSEEEVETQEEEAESTKPKVKKAKAEIAMVTEREEIPRLATPPHRSFKIISWNVNGFGAVAKSNLKVLQDLVNKEQPDILCLQETKLQLENTEQYNELLSGYKAYWNCSMTKKGYAGTAVFIRMSDQEASNGNKKKITSFFTQKGGKTSSTEAKAGDGKGGAAVVVRVSNGINKKEHDGEGRCIVVEYDKFYVVNVYVPNSGMKLERLDYRLKKWNPTFQKFLEDLRDKKPVILTGDLNVAHLDSDIYNYGAKHIKKVPGCTDEERQAQTDFLKSGWCDYYRSKYPAAKGQYTYWSVRTGARKENKGLRLDYFICSENTLTSEHVALYDSYILHKETNGVSDHCPVALVLKMGDAS